MHAENMLSKICPLWLYPPSTVESDIMSLVFVVENKTKTWLLIEKSSCSRLLQNLRSVQIPIEF